MSFRGIFKKCFNKFGYDLIRIQDLDNGRPVINFIRREKIDLVLDVGANHGQYGSGLRREGYDGRIVSFEPLSSAFQVLKGVSCNDKNWQIVNTALGSAEAEEQLNISLNSQSSSLLEINSRHLEAAPEAHYVGKESIKVCRLDSLIHEYCRKGERVFLKIDAQGYERKILEGAERSLDFICGLQLEMSLYPLYQEEVLFGDMTHYLSQHHFVLIAIEPGFRDRRTGRLLQVDGLFMRIDTNS